jgi:hypothetical protein
MRHPAEQREQDPEAGPAVRGMSIAIGGGVGLYTGAVIVAPNSDALLLESGDYLLLENGDNILME